MPLHAEIRETKTKLAEARKKQENTQPKFGSVLDWLKQTRTPIKELEQKYNSLGDQHVIKVFGNDSPQAKFQQALKDCRPFGLTFEHADIEDELLDYANAMRKFTRDPKANLIDMPTLLPKPKFMTGVADAPKDWKSRIEDLSKTAVKKASIRTIDDPQFGYFMHFGKAAREGTNLGKAYTKIYCAVKPHENVDFAKQLMEFVEKEKKNGNELSFASKFRPDLDGIEHDNFLFYAPFEHVPKLLEHLNKVKSKLYPLERSIRLAATSNDLPGVSVVIEGEGKGSFTNEGIAPIHRGHGDFSASVKDTDSLMKILNRLKLTENQKSGDHFKFLLARAGLHQP